MAVSSLSSDYTPPVKDPAARQRWIALIDLLASAEVIMRSNLRRRNPGATREELDELFQAWLDKRDTPPFQGVGRSLSQEEVERRFGPVPAEQVSGTR